MRVRWRIVGGKLSVLALLVATALMAIAGAASAKQTRQFVGSLKPNPVSEVDCNGWSDKYPPARPAARAMCTDPIHISAGGKTSRLIDNGWYVGHDEPSVKFISSTPGSGNTMSYQMQLPVDPSAAPTASGSVTDYGELSIAPWFGLPMCDSNSYPQNPCTPDSDSNSGSITDPNAAGSAFMELQFYPPGFTPFIDAFSCSATQWCSALNIDSLECSFNFATCNTNCEEPVNFAFLQTNGVPSGPAAPQDPNAATYLGNAQTLKMNPGDVLVVSISDPAAGFTVSVHDLTTGQTGTMVASAANGFADTNMSDCSGNPHTWHAEYSTAEQPNQVPWAAAEGGVLMEQEIGHFESCDSVNSRDPYSTAYGDGSSYSDPSVFQTCDAGIQGPNAVGQGPCNPAGTSCVNPTTQGFDGPTACPTKDATTGALCEFSDGYCFQGGARSVKIDGAAATESSLLNGCLEDQFQNGDLDFDGNSYQSTEWPNGSADVPTPMRYVGPFMADGDPYSQVQFESDVAGSESLCDVTTGTNCTAPPMGSEFYPFWSLNNSQTLAGTANGAGTCVWNFGNDVAGVTNNDFGGDGQYGSPDVVRYGGTVISGVRTNPAKLAGCGAPTASAPPTIAGPAEQGQTLTESHSVWSNGSTSFGYQWEDCDSAGNNCSPISGATAQTYVPTATDVGHTIAVQETVSGTAGTIGRATSSPTAVVTQAPPSSVSPPTISGNTTQGQTLTEAHATWLNNPTSFAYQWEDCDSSGNNCSTISGATAQTYTLTGADVGHEIVVQESATNSTNPSPPASSAPTTVVQPFTTTIQTIPTSTAPPVISGTARVGATLTSTTGLWSGSPPLSYSYQWQRCKRGGCVNVSGATSNAYKLVKADFGNRIDVLVTATNSLSRAAQASSQTGPIGPGVAQLKTLLAHLLVPRGAAAKGAALLSRGGYGFSFKTPSAGWLVVAWSHGRQVVGTVSTHFSKAKRVRTEIALTLKGAHLLGGSGRPKLTAKGTFIPSGLPATTQTKRFKLRR